MIRTFDGNFMVRVALEELRKVKSVAEIAWLYETHPNLVVSWKSEALKRLLELFEGLRYGGART